MIKSNVEEFINIISLAYMCLGNEDFPLLVENKIGKGSDLFFWQRKVSQGIYREQWVLSDESLFCNPNLQLWATNIK